jgi:hypothetical protein
MIIEFLDNVDRALATPLQLETYDLLKATMAEGDEVPLADLLEALELQDHRPLISRIKHLAEKGFLHLCPETDEEQVEVEEQVAVA